MLTPPPSALRFLLRSATNQLLRSQNPQFQNSMAIPTPRHLPKFLILFLAFTTHQLIPGYAIPTKTIIDASTLLTNSGFTSMSLMLEFVSPQTQIPNSPAVTIFAPPDSAFSKSGQPSLSLFQLHIVPLAFTFDSLKSLPSGTKIQTMANKSLIVTSDRNKRIISVNSIAVNGSPLFSDGFLVIYGVDDFFDPNFLFSTSNPNTTVGCVPSGTGNQDLISDKFLFAEASEALRSRGYAVMASFLDVQLMVGFSNGTKMTVFAPVDVVMETLVGKVGDYGSLFRRHVIPCKLTWLDLMDLRDGISLKSYLEGFMIVLTRTTDTFSESADNLMLNEVQIEFPDLYQNDWLVVHGLNDMLMVPDNGEDGAEDFNSNGATQEFRHAGDEF